jgi:hypothetical protein
MTRSMLVNETFRRTTRVRLASPLICWLFLLPHPAFGQSKPYVTLDQGPAWTTDSRREFYIRDQGSRIMPLSWMVALKQPNGNPFLEASLGRYGYLENEFAEKAGLPVGFTISSSGYENFLGGSEVVGMTCAACHTRQISANDKVYRIDGAPGIVDLQSFLADLDKAVEMILADKARFTDFAKIVLGNAAPADQVAKLREQVKLWFDPFHAIVTGGLPTSPWGLGRLDAVGMILNRITGLDIGTSPGFVIPENIRTAAAPVRYPFLWNAPIQDKTQWPGIADNGNDILGLARNLGEVYGVFAIFHPKKDNWHLLGVRYLNNNSANFDGLDALEGLVKKLGRPKFPGPIDLNLAVKGQTIFARSTDTGGCVECHAISPGKTRFFDQKTWHTELRDVGTDSKQYELLQWTAKTGVLAGAGVPLFMDALKPTDLSINVLKLSVVGTILQRNAPVLMAADVHAAEPAAPAFLFSAANADLKGAFQYPDVTALSPYRYEARVLEGIWAAAPYLHNGSVPTLAELLKPAAARVATFQIGASYDLVNLGLSVDQPGLSFTLSTTACDARGSGNSRCGHEYGTRLPADEKSALLEYLKTL